MHNVSAFSRGLLVELSHLFFCYKTPSWFLDKLKASCLSLTTFLEPVIWCCTMPWKRLVKTFKSFAFYLSSESFSVVDFWFIKFLCGSLWNRWNSRKSKQNKSQQSSSIPRLKKIIWVIGVLSRTVVCNRTFRQPVRKPSSESSDWDYHWVSGKLRPKTYNPGQK